MRLQCTDKNHMSANSLKEMANSKNSIFIKGIKQANHAYYKCVNAAKRGGYELRYTGPLNDDAINILAHRGFQVQKDKSLFGWIRFWNNSWVLSW